MDNNNNGMRSSNRPMSGNMNNNNNSSSIRGQQQHQSRQLSGKQTERSQNGYASNSLGNNNNNNNNNMRKGRQNQRSGSGGGSSTYRSTQGKWPRNEQNYDSMSSNSDRERYGGRNRAPRYQRNPLPQTDPENPFVFEISDYDVELSTRTMQAQYELYSQLTVDQDILQKFQALAAVAQQNLYRQQSNYNEFMEDKRQHEIERWLASMSEEDRRQYLERTKMAGARQPVTTKAQQPKDNVEVTANQSNNDEETGTGKDNGQEITATNNSNASDNSSSNEVVTNEGKI